MKTAYCLVLCIAPFLAYSQENKDSVHKKSNSQQKNFYIGLKAGLNFSNVTSPSSIGASTQTGFHAGVFLNIGSKIIGSRTEILFSKQGYNYSSDSSSGMVINNYIMLAQLIGINITRFVQLQVGMQMGYLLNAKADSSQSTGNATVDKLLSSYNRFDYAISGGLEIHPVAGLLIGARYNYSLSNLYQQYIPTSGGSSPGASKLKNNIVQVFIGYRF